jgi:translation initiation factor IF-2
MAEKRAASEMENDGSILQVTEFISVSEFANLLDVPFTEVISKCMSLGIMVSINQRLDAEVIELVASEFDREVEFINLDSDNGEEEAIVDDPADMVERAPVVTIMGHVDHGKTSLLDYIRNASVVAGEAGGITQHIGAYKVATASGKEIAFLDTPGHEAFTAMRARGAKAADVAVIVVAADDAIMPQTKEAISHAQAAGLPMIFAINKIDKEAANPEKIKEQLASMNILVEDWGGTYQCQEISAKKGLNIDLLLEKILLEAEMLELKANPNREADGSVIEASLDKGRGYVSTILVQGGTLKQGDMLVSGQYYGKVKAMFNERGQKVTKAGPSTPVQVLGLNGAPQAGEKIKVYEDETEAKNVATHRSQILREQGLRSRKHITLDEIGRRLALGNFKELNVIIRADVDGSAEALSDSLQKLSTDEVVVNVVHKGVGQISEGDVNLASASDAIILGFQVRPSVQAARLADQENIEIRYYSVIYDAIGEIKSAMEGLLEPTIEKKIVGNIEVRDTFKISGVGTIAGCYVLDGKFTRNTKINIIRDGIVVHTGELSSLKRFKDDVKEVNAGYECGLMIKNYNDIQVNDIIEGYEEVEVKRKLA